MPNAKHFPPGDLVHDLTMSLWRERAALRDLARRKAWEPSIDDCRRLAERQVEQLKSHGVLEDGETVQFGKRHLHIRTTPGHTRRCLAYVLDDQTMAFMGDGGAMSSVLATLLRAIATIRHRVAMDLDALLPF